LTALKDKFFALEKDHVQGMISESGSDELKSVTFCVTRWATTRWSSETANLGRVSEHELVATPAQEARVFIAAGRLLQAAPFQPLQSPRQLFKRPVQLPDAYFQPPGFGVVAVDLLLPGPHLKQIWETQGPDAF
jgi:hypothetical protein